MAGSSHRTLTRSFYQLSPGHPPCADLHGVPGGAGLMAAFSGPELDQDMPQEYIKDDVHPSDEGAVAIGDVLADLGYEPVSPTEGSSSD